jgi:hypothetical protein
MWNLDGRLLQNFAAVLGKYRRMLASVSVKPFNLFRINSLIPSSYRRPNHFGHQCAV